MGMRGDIDHYRPAEYKNILSEMIAIRRLCALSIVLITELFLSCKKLNPFIHPMKHF